MDHRLLRAAGSLLLCVLLVSALLIPAAAAGDTVTLSGPISGQHRIDEDVTKVILDGVQAADLDAVVAIPNSCEVELKDGTENTCGVYCVGDLRLTGGGKLTGGWGIVATENLMLDLAPEGAVLLDAGNYIFTFHGDITVNSGTYRIQSDAPDAPYPILAMDGSIALNGGDVAVWSTESCIVSMNGTITVGDTKLDLNSPKDLMIANEISVAQSSGSGPEVLPNTERKDYYVPGGSLQRTDDGFAHSDTPGAAVIENGVADVGTAAKLAPGSGGTDSPDAETSGDPAAEQQGSEAGKGLPTAAWIAISAAAVAAAAAVVFLLKQRKQKKKGK